MGNLIENFVSEHEANLKDSITATSLAIFFKLDSNHWFFSPYGLDYIDDLEKQQGTSSRLHLSFAHYFKAISEFKLELQSGNAQFRSKWAIFCPVWPSNWQMTLKIIRAPLLCYFKLCATFDSHQSIQILVTVQKHQIRIQIGDFRVTLKFDGWPWKTICYFKLCASFRSHLSIQTWIGNGLVPIIDN